MTAVIGNVDQVVGHRPTLSESCRLCNGPPHNIQGPLSIQRVEWYHMKDKNLIKQPDIAKHRIVEDMRQRYEFIVNTSKDFMTLIDRNYRYEAVNEAYCQAHSRSRSEIIGKHVAEVWGREQYEVQIEAHLNECFAGNEVHYQRQFKVPKLGWRYFDVAYYPYYNDAGHVTHTVVVSRDATERKQAEEQLRSSEERFRQVISSISDHVYVTRITSTGERINLYLSPNVETLTGYPQKEFAHDWYFWASTVIYPDDRGVAATQAAALAKGQNSEVEYRMTRADGKLIWVRDSARVQVNDQEKVIYGLVSDITERKQAEEGIRKFNEELEQRVADRTRELAALYDVTMVASEALDLETTLERLLERSLAAMRSKMGTIHTLDDAREILQLDVQQGLSAETVAHLGAVESGLGLPGWVIKQGESLFVPDLTYDSRAPQTAADDGLQSYVGVPMRTGGQILGVLSVFGHIDQHFNVEEVALLASIGDQVGVIIENARLRQRAEQAAVLEERGRLARELHDSVTQSLYSLTLLAGGWLRLTKAGRLENFEECLSDIGGISQQALKEMRLLVHQLRPAILEQEGLVGALQQRLDAVEGRSGVKTRLLVGELLEIPGPVEDGLYRITQEALNNSLKHASAASVVVRIHMEGGQVILEVADDGQGFDFASGLRKNGLGLISMQERADMMDGTLTVRTEQGQGTMVSIAVNIS